MSERVQYLAFFPDRRESVEVDVVISNWTAEWGYRFLSNLIGGNVELVTVTGGCGLYFDEDGKAKGLKVNHTATRLAHDAKSIHPWDVIVGPAVLVGPVDFEGNDTSLSSEVIAQLTRP